MKTADEALALLKSGTVTHVSLDHDLGDLVNGTGYQAARWVEEHTFRWAEGAADGLPRLTWNIHSQNPARVGNMAKALRNADRFWRARP